LVGKPIAVSVSAAIVLQPLKSLLPLLRVAFMGMLPLVSSVLP
jgi:hypothetical protein